MDALQDRRRFLRLVLASCVGCVAGGCSRARSGDGSGAPDPPPNGEDGAPTLEAGASLPLRDASRVNPDASSDTRNRPIPENDASASDASTRRPHEDASVSDAGTARARDAASEQPPVAHTDEVRVPVAGVGVGAIVLLQHGVLVGRDALGIYALTAVCPHVGCLVSLPGVSTACAGAQHDWFVCECHCSLFDAAGRRQSGPATQDLVHFAATIDGTDIVIDRGTIVPPETRLMP